MRIYNIYLDRIEFFDGQRLHSASLEFKLYSLAADLYSLFIHSGLGKCHTYRRMALLIDNLRKVILYNEGVNEEYVVGVLRYSLSFLRRYKFPEFQINILNHV